LTTTIPAVALFMMSLLTFLTLLLYFRPVDGWVSRPEMRTHWRNLVLPSEQPLRSKVVDADFERVDPGKKQSSRTKNGSLLDNKQKNLLDLVFESDSEISKMRIPFLDYTRKDPSGNVDYIDVKLAFMAELDGVQYGIAVPCDAAVALTFETPDGTVQNIAPDVDENEELMQIMAAQLAETIGQDLKLMRTPRVLTVSGPLDNYTKNWETELMPEPYGIDTLLEPDENFDTADALHAFFKKELGEEEYAKTLNEEMDDAEMEEMMKFFEIPGLGTQANDEEGIKAMMETLLEPEIEFEEAKQKTGVKDLLESDSAALKILSYIFPKGRSYSLVKLLKPFVIVAKFVSDPNDPRFELLTAEEEKVIIPRLEEVCKADLVKAGLTEFVARP
jgi:hypothetical protein